MADHRTAFADDEHVQVVEPDRTVGQVEIDCQPGDRHTLKGVAVEVFLGKAIAGVLGDVGGDECDIAVFVLGDEVDAIIAVSPIRGEDGVVAAVEESFNRLSCLADDCCFHDEDLLGLRLTPVANLVARMSLGFVQGARVQSKTGGMNFA